MSRFFPTSPSKSQPYHIQHPEFGSIQYIPSLHARNMRISVKPFQGVMVRFPKGVSRSHIEKFVASNHDWIKNAINHARGTEIKSRAHFQAHRSTDKKEIKRHLGGRLATLAKRHEFQYNKVSYRNQKSRWGSCSAQNNISLNMKLYFLPPELMDYVLVHELAHTREKNHGPAFWKILITLFGEDKTRDLRKKLKTYEYLLYPPE